MAFFHFSVRRGVTTPGLGLARIPAGRFRPAGRIASRAADQRTSPAAAVIRYAVISYAVIRYAVISYAVISYAVISYAVISYAAAEIYNRKKQKHEKMSKKHLT